MADTQPPTLEERILTALAAGSWASLGQVGADEGQRAQPGPALHAELLAHLLTQRREPSPRTALRISHARVAGALDLSGIALAFPVEFVDCIFMDSLSLDRVSAPAIRLTGCRLERKLIAEQLETVGDFELARITAPGVHLVRARIGGQLDLRGARLHGGDGPALDAREVTVEHSVRCCEDWNSRAPFRTRGGVLLSGARIGGDLDLSGAQLLCRDHAALDATNLAIAHNLLGGAGARSRAPLVIAGEMRLGGAHVAGRLELTGAQIRNGTETALDADSIRVDKDVRCHQDTRTGVRFRVRGLLRLSGARIGGKLDLSGADLANDGKALGGYAMTIEQDLLCEPKGERGAPLTVRGQVDLNAAHVKGAVKLNRAAIDNANKPALTGSGLRIEQELMCNDLRVSGEVSLYGARVGGRVALGEARLINSQGIALNGAGLHVDKDVNLRRFTADGAVLLVGARIGGELNVTGSSLTAGARKWALDAFSVDVAQSLIAREAFADGGMHLNAAKVGGQLDLTGAQLSNTDDAALTASGLRLSGGMSCKPGLARFTASGGVNLVSAQIGGHLNLREARLTSVGASRPSGTDRAWALDAYGLRVDGSLIADAGLRADGGVNLNSARIGRDLNFRGAQLTSMADPGLDATSLHVGLNLTFAGRGNRTGSFISIGEIRLSGAYITGRLVLNDARLWNRDGPSLDASSATIIGDIRCKGMTALAPLRFVATRVDGELDLTDATVRVLVLRRSQTGTLSLPGTGFWLKARRAAGPAGASLVEDAKVDLTDARTGHLVDPAEHQRRGRRRWLKLRRRPAPTPDPPAVPYRPQLTGFVYGTLTNQRADTADGRRSDLVDRAKRPRRGWRQYLRPRPAPAPRPPSVPSRRLVTDLMYGTFARLRADVATDKRKSEPVERQIAWIEHADDEQYVPATYDRLDTVLRQAGREEDARRIALAKFRHRRTTLSSPGRALSFLLDIIAGYGYRPLRTAGWFALLVVTSAIAFGWAYPENFRLTKPANAVTTRASPTSTPQDAKTPESGPPKFRSALFALDAAIPAVSLGQEASYSPVGWAQWCYAGCVVLGWLFVPLLIAALTARLVRA
jgi:hypothetical protein